jgi:hypothetical protein
MFLKIFQHFFSLSIFLLFEFQCATFSSTSSFSSSLIFCAHSKKDYYSFISDHPENFMNVCNMKFRHIKNINAESKNLVRKNELVCVCERNKEIFFKKFSFRKYFSFLVKQTFLISKRDT